MMRLSKNITGNDDMSSYAFGIAAAIKSASSPDVAKGLMGQLIALLMQGKLSTGAMAAISQAIATAQAHIATMQTEERDDIRTRIDPARFAVDAHSQTLYDALTDETRGILTKAERNYLQAIDSNAVYKIPVFDQHGNLQEGAHQHVTGAEVRKSFSMVKSVEHYHKLTDEEKKALHQTLHGQDHAPRTHEERATATKNLQDAAKVVAGHKLSVSAAPQERQTICNDLSSELANASQLISSLSLTQGIDLAIKPAKPVIPEMKPVTAPAIPEFVTPSVAKQAVEAVTKPPETFAPVRSSVVETKAPTEALPVWKTIQPDAFDALMALDINAIQSFVISKQIPVVVPALIPLVVSQKPDKLMGDKQVQTSAR